MSYFKHKTDLRFSRNRREVEELCTRLFGPKHLKTRDRDSGKVKDNHGNWKVCQNSFTFKEESDRIAFRYEKDLTWFMLHAAHLADPPRESISQ